MNLVKYAALLLALVLVGCAQIKNYAEEKQASATWRAEQYPWAYYPIDEESKAKLCQALELSADDAICQDGKEIDVGDVLNLVKEKFPAGKTTIDEVEVSLGEFPHAPERIHQPDGTWRDVAYDYRLTNYKGFCINFVLNDDDETIYSILASSIASGPIPTTCGPPITTPTTSPSATSVPTEPPTPTNTATPLPSVTPTPTATVTPSPSSTPTASPTAVPTLTPLPTIPQQERGEAYSELMVSNGGCELPCWWGFELGKTSKTNIHQFYATFDPYIVEQYGDNGLSAIYIQFADPQIDDGKQINHVYLAKDENIIEADIELGAHADYQIEPILHRLGQPSEVWMWTIPEPFEGIMPARFRYYFPEHGVLFLHATGARRINDEVHICFNEPGGAIIRLWDPAVWDPENKKGLVERAKVSSTLEVEGGSIEEVSNWDPEHLYNVLTDPNNSECLQTPAELWPHP